ncbi:molybdopterin-binding protein [soil metagenome]
MTRPPPPPADARPVSAASTSPSSPSTAHRDGSAPQQSEARQVAYRVPAPWQHARTLASGIAAPLPTETVDLADALWRVLGEDVEARHDVPHYSSSAMDGWAVAGAAPWAIVSAGQPYLRPGQAAPILTGALIPPGAEAVLRSESGAAASSRLSLHPQAPPHEPRPGQHIRPRGEEARAGDTVITRGTVLNPAHIAVAAACAHDTLRVIRRPRVAFVFTGDEVDEAGAPPPGRVRDSFGPQLPGTFRMLGATPVGSRRCPDTLEATTSALAQSSLTADVVITTGGTGRSAADHLRSALESLGASIHIDGVAMRPGGPTMLARLPGGAFVVCLPGNPLAAMMGLITVAEPLLARLSGRKSSRPRRVTVASAVAGRPGTTLLIPCAIRDGEATPNGWLGSGMMRGLADADGVLVVPEQGVEPGEPGESLGLPWCSPAPR